MLWKIYPGFKLRHIFHRLNSIFKHTYLSHFVYTKMYYIIILVIISYQIKFPVISNYSVRIYNITLFSSGMKLKIGSYIIIYKTYLMSLWNSIIYLIYRVDVLSVYILVKFRYITYIWYFCIKVFTWKPSDFLNQFFCLIWRKSFWK